MDTRNYFIVVIGQHIEDIQIWWGGSKSASGALTFSSCDSGAWLENVIWTALPVSLPDSSYVVSAGESPLHKAFGPDLQGPASDMIWNKEHSFDFAESLSKNDDRF